LYAAANKNTFLGHCAFVLANIQMYTLGALRCTLKHLVQFTFY